jgi:hypothetical protein
LVFGRARAEAARPELRARRFLVSSDGASFAVRLRSPARPSPPAHALLLLIAQDDEVEILEVKRANSGRDPFPAFLKKGKLAKNLETMIRTDAPTTHTTQLIDRSGKVDPASMAYYSESDFAVGKQILVNGITFLIYDCDKYTRDYYEQVRLVVLRFVVLRARG